MRKIVLFLAGLFLMSTVAVYAENTNLMENPSFDNGMEGWKSRVVKGEGEITLQESYEGRNQVLRTEGRNKDAQLHLYYQPEIPFKPGYAYKIGFSYIKEGEMGKYNSGTLYLRFLDEENKELSYCPLRPLTFRIYENTQGWQEASQEFYVPEKSKKFVLNLSFRGKNSFYLDDFCLTEIKKITLKKPDLPHLLFQEDFESFPGIFANGGMVLWPYDSTLTSPDMKIVEGKFGNALCIRNERCTGGIRYFPVGKINVNEGTIEFYQKVLYKDIDVYKDRGLVVFWLEGVGAEKSKTTRIQIFSGCYQKKMFGVRFSGAGPDQWVPYGESPEEWHHVAVTWKVNQGEDKSEFSMYIDGILKARKENVTIELDQGKVEKPRKDVYLKIGGSYRNHGEEIIIDRFRIWDKALVMTEE